MIDPEDKGRLLQAVAIVALATVGGLLGYLSRASDSGERVTFGQMALKAGSAGFCGCLVFFACQWSGLDWLATGILAGLAGWMGAEATIQVLTNQVRKRLGLDREENRDDRS